ncbi:hypothetical protein [Actinomadura sp. NPDC000600]|uniref:hypothetical protein n=1 Tax=Actinomadura sp. NPDC000600 TaxID=3154262 RepID=UPI00339B97C6
MTEDSTDYPQLGLLDLAADLSVPDVYSGSDFTLYLHIKNPFQKQIWIRSVELSLPTQLHWRAPSKAPVRNKVDPEIINNIERRINQREERMAAIRKRLQNRDVESEVIQKLDSELDDLEKKNESDWYVIASLRAHMVVTADKGGQINLGDVATESLAINAQRDSQIYIGDVRALSSAEQERIPLIGSLPRNVALEPGCTDVWTIRLGSSRNPFFIPAQYRLQLTVIYGLEPMKGGKPTAGEDRVVGEGRTFSNTTALIVSVKAALWNVISGGLVGGAIGSVGRSLQGARSLDLLFDQQLSGAIGALLLALILSGAGIVFAARKSNTQAFISVEDFWGGLLVGFLIGYSGTAAFSNITGVPTE